MIRPDSPAPRPFPTPTASEIGTVVTAIEAKQVDDQKLFIPESLPSLARQKTGISVVSTINSVISSDVGDLSPILADMEFTVKALLSEQGFALSMKDNLARFRFRDYLLLSDASSVISFDLWTDLKDKVLTDRVNLSSQALHENFEFSENLVSVEVREQVLDSLRSGMEVSESLNLVQEQLLRSLFEKEFVTYVRHKLMEDASTRLGFEVDHENGLGDAFCPRLPDHPIVLVSEAFEKLTGFGAKQIVGKNCRFLSGPATSENSIEKIRVGLNTATPTTTLLLNYKRNGESFMNLLTILPLFGANGELTYFIGGQTEVTSNLTRLLSAPSQRYSPGTEGNFDYSDAKFAPQTNSLIQELSRNGDSSRKVSLALANSRIRSYGSSLASSGKRSAAGLRTATRTESNNSATTKISSLHNSKPETPTSTGSSGVGTLKNLFQRTTLVRAKTSNSTLFSQAIAGAENNESAVTVYAPLDAQVEHFSSIYSRIILIRAADRNMLFASAEIIKFLGLPTATRADLFNNSLISQDFLSILKSSSSSGKSVRKQITESIKQGIPITIQVSLKVKNGRTDIGNLRLLLTPLFATPSSQPDAFVAVFA